MQQNSIGHSLSETEFNNLCSHYKDTYEIHLASMKRRDRLFYALLVILALFLLQITSADLVSSILSHYIENKLKTSIDKDLNLFGTLFWFLLFGFSSRYYQTVIEIERQYNYIHDLEEILNSKYAGTCIFTREGKAYLDKYPLFSSWVRWLYTWAFPLIILLCISIRIYDELANYKALGLALVPGVVFYLLVGIFTILYIGKLHSLSLRKLLKRVKATIDHKSSPE
uniref:Uncharacterized protein n=1 Tax=Candidatus Kentrum sp. TUN TaxID=2126343 RepID=A0A451A0M1_9GAMM|nr:MAG: hypothetical protein BECKTUN1418F_GA0071002_10544 [Candidatus Kentron sp. TUN]VFK59574.1 MAG: hypothetical protein BECKTUN1418E_GA0071001_10544 [Candidatus Kentron sp. TUN]